MSGNLQPGDVVRVKSGGPKMTIDKIGQFGMGSKEEARCVWFDGNKRVTDLFQLEILEKVDEEPKPSPRISTKPF